MSTPAQTIFVFPGQGSQAPGMATAFMAHPHTKTLFEEIDDALSFSLSTLMRDGPADDLTATQNAQPALLTAGLAALTFILKASGLPLSHLAAAVAGHSLGEISAVTAAGGLPIAIAAKLVRLRGEAMATAVPTAQGSMSAVLGPDLATLEPAVAPTGAFIANDNAPGQTILSGLIPALMDAEDAARSLGARRVLRLNVSGPFHTPLMQPAATALTEFLIDNPLQPLAVPCWANVTAAPAAQPAAVTANLIAQITGRVRWRETMQNLAAQNFTQVVELGAGAVLTSLAPRCDARLQAVSLTDPDSISRWLDSSLKAT